MNLTQALEFIQSASWLGSRPGLERITELMHRLEDPQNQLRYIHITGTNGKGSTAAMLSSILTRAGYTTGLFTSPHLQRYHERIQVNGAEISDQELCAMADAVRPAVEEMEAVPTEFERFTAMAFLYFQRRGCDIVVLEVGLGGRLDCTNVIQAPEAAVITNIGLEHTEYLGDTVEKIAAEKAGIIKPGCDVVLYGQSAGAEQAVRKKCGECGCPLTVTDPAQETLVSRNLDGQVLHYRQRRDLSVRLLGTYQYKNAAVVLDTVDALVRRGWKIPESAVQAGLASVVWPGRFEVLRREPLVIVDGAHNPNGVTELAQCLRDYLPGRKFTFVMGVLADKDYSAMLDTVAPLARDFITVTPDSHRALSSAELSDAIRVRLRLPARDSGGAIEDGLALAMASAKPDDAVCVFGSLYQAGAVRAFFGK